MSTMGTFGFEKEEVLKEMQKLNDSKYNQILEAMMISMGGGISQNLPANLIPFINMYAEKILYPFVCDLIEANNKKITRDVRDFIKINNPKI